MKRWWPLVFAFWFAACAAGEAVQGSWVWAAFLGALSLFAGHVATFEP